MRTKLALAFNALGKQRIGGNVLSVRSLAFVVGKACLFAAVGFVFLLGDMLAEAEKTNSPTVDLQPTQTGGEKRQPEPLAGYSVVTSTSIFGRTKDAPKAQPTAAAASNLKMRLVAVNQVSNGGSFAIIEDTAKQNQEVFDLNETVFGQGQLTEINADNVKIKRGERIETLTMLDISTSTAPSSGGGSDTPTEGQTEFSVPEDELAAALANLPQLLSQARAVPYFRNGQSIGMRLFAIRSGSMYEKLGLKNGDIVLSVNDNSLSDPAQALKLFEQLKTEHSINVKLERNSQNMDMRYSIR